MVGVNRFQSEGQEAMPVFQIRPDVETQQVERLRELRASRDGVEWKARIAALREAAVGGDNLMPRILEAARARATVGEVADTLRDVFGEYREGAANP